MELLPALLRYLGVSEELAMMLAAASHAGATGGLLPQPDSGSAGIDPAANREVPLASAAHALR